MIPRKIRHVLKVSSETFPITVLIGPGQSGKTTVAKNTFPDKPYVSLEDPGAGEYALGDPRGFISGYPGGAVIDDVQRVPEIISFLRNSACAGQGRGPRFILTSSRDIPLAASSFNGSAGTNVLKLLPLSYEELTGASVSYDEYVTYLYKGFYPKLYDRHIKPAAWYSSYISTYIERDLRLIKNVTDLRAFYLFMKMCAARTGQILNLTSLAEDCGITHNTARAWIRVLESSFIIFLFEPCRRNFNRRTSRTPKLYFYDPGLVCSLLGIEEEKQLETCYLKGRLFETFVITEMMKFRYNRGLKPGCCYWRDKTGHEIDCLFEEKCKDYPVEIKSGKTPNRDYFRYIKYFNKLTGTSFSDSYVIYGGDTSQKQKTGNLLSWKNIGSLPFLSREPEPGI